MRKLALLLLARAEAFRVAFYTCRHEYEATLMRELSQAGIPRHAITSPLPALVRVDHSALPVEGVESLLDPTYALQVLPHASEVHGASVRLLSQAALRACIEETPPIVASLLQCAPRGTLRIHSLVPDLLKGGRTPRLLRRCDSIAAALTENLRKRYRCARKGNKGSQMGVNEKQPLLLLQLLLLSPEKLIVSLAQCEHVGLGVWPNWHVPAGLAGVDNDRIVDLGACPGGWTQALRR
ncbi:MAG: hypothetical protein SGPRY_002077 [Prymnesium sp.]